jgi:hypothetical protein
MNFTITLQKPQKALYFFCSFELDLVLLLEKSLQCFHSSSDVVVEQ